MIHGHSNRLGVKSKGALGNEGREEDDDAGDRELGAIEGV